MQYFLLVLAGEVLSRIHWPCRLFAMGKGLAFHIAVNWGCCQCQSAWKRCSAKNFTSSFRPSFHFASQQTDDAASARLHGRSVLLKTSPCLGHWSGPPFFVADQGCVIFPSMDVPFHSWLTLKWHHYFIHWMGFFSRDVLKGGPRVSQPRLQLPNFVCILLLLSCSQLVSKVASFLNQSMPSSWPPVCTRFPSPSRPSQNGLGPVPFAYNLYTITNECFNLLCCF